MNRHNSIYPTGCPRYLNFDREIFRVSVSPQEKRAPQVSTTNVHDHHGKSVLAGLRIFLLLGKFLGLVPIQGLWQGDVQKLHFRKLSLASIWSFLIWSILSANCVVGFISMVESDRKNAADCAWAPAMLIFFGTALFIHVVLYNRTTRFIQVLTQLSNMSLGFTMPDRHLFRDVNIVTFSLMTSAIIDNALMHLKLFPVAAPSHGWRSPRETPGSTAIEIYYYRSHPQWAALVPYHLSIAMFVFIGNKLTVYAGNYMDILIIVLSRTIYFKFKTVYEQGEVILVGNFKLDEKRWEQLMVDHESLRCVLREIQNFLGPFIFITYGLSVYWTCLQLLIGLSAAIEKSSTADISIIASIYATWSFLHLIARIVMVTLAGSRVHEWAHQLSHLIQECPAQAYSTQVQRTDQILSKNFIGLTGLNCFLVQRSLILNATMVVLTFEIILMQAFQQSVLANEKKFNDTDGVAGQ